MSEAIVTFQSQLSGVMETVFKAAMYEITRLVEDSFLKEVSRSREQVESLKKRLLWSENRRRERDREGGRTGKCADCAETGRGLKQEKVPGEEWSSCGGVAGETAFHDLEEAEATSPRRTSESTEVGGQKLDSLLKEEALHNTELQERWDKSFSEQELQQCQDDWGSGLDQGPEPPGPEGDPGDPTDPLYRPRYSMEELGGGFEKSGYGGDGGGDHILDMEGLDRLPGSPSRLGALTYVSHFQVNLGGSEGGDHHHRSHMPGPHRSRRERVGSPTRSPHPEVGDLNCLLINEEGYLQDSSVLYPEHGVPESGNRADHRGLTSIHSGSSAHNNNTESLYGAADNFGHSLNLRDRSQEQLTGRGGGGGRRHACNHMSENLVLTFQAQLSGVMETVLKSAMYEITRLVEDGFLEEVRRGQQEVTRSHQEVESLRTLLQQAESQLKNGSQMARCADCGRTDVYNEETDDRPPGMQNSVLLLSGCDLKQEEEPEVRWRSCGQETVESSQVAAKPTPPTPPAPSPSLVGSVKEEEEGEEDMEPWRMKVDIQPSAAHTYTEEQRDSHTLGQSTGDSIGFLSADPEAQHVTQTPRPAGPSQNQSRGPSNDGDGTRSRASPVWISHRILDTDTDVHRRAQSNLRLVREPLSSSESAEAKQQARDLAPPANPSTAGASVSSSSSSGSHVFSSLNYRIPSKYKPSPQALPRMRVYRDAAKRGGYIMSAPLFRQSCLA
ncbi:unnamed protein product [Coregonus sp. 'balchen']|nr:unnamed protein product [Coregonus sp. 'balchen']